MDTETQETQVGRLTAIKIWLGENKIYFTLTVISTLVFLYHSANQNARQMQIEQELREIRQIAAHDKETDFALRLSGLRQTATITETAMREYYQTHLELIEVAKPCNIPPQYRNIKPLPNYVPAAAIYLEEKQKVIERSKEH